MEAFQRRLVRRTTSIDAGRVPFSKVLSTSVLSVLPFFLLLICIVSSRSMWSYVLFLLQESPTLRILFLNILIGCIIAISQKRKCSFQVETEHEAENEDRWIPPLITRNLDSRNGAEAEIGVVERTLMVPGSGTNSSKQEEDSYFVAKEDSPTVATVRRDADNKQLVIENLSADRIKRVAGNRSTKRRVQPSSIADGSKLASLKERTNRCNGDYIGPAEAGKDNGRRGDAKHRAAMKKAKHGLRAGEVDTKGANTTDKNGFQACPSMEEVWVHIMSNRHERGCESTINQETQRTVQKETRAPCINEGAEGENHQAAAASSPGEEISRPPDKGALDGNSVRTPSELMEVQELNRRAEEFIRRVNREIRRQTKESLRQRRQRYADHSEPLNHCLLEPPSPAVHGLLVR